MRGVLPWRPLILQAAAIWAVTRVAYAGFTFYALLFSSGDRRLYGRSFTAHDLLASWIHWDAHWYIRIAILGYQKQQFAAFFPLYPLLIHVGTLLVGQAHINAVALVIANIGTLGAFIAIALLVANETGAAEASWRTLRIYVAFPLALFLTAPYTESLFLAWAGAALLCARRGSWRWAALWALLAGFTRSTCVALVLPLLWEFGRQHGWWRRDAWTNARWRERFQPLVIRDAALAVLAAPAAILMYMLYCWFQVGNALAFLNAERYWGHYALPFGQGLVFGIGDFLHAPFLSDVQAKLLFNLAPPLLVLGVTLASVKRAPLAFTLYSFGVLYLSLASPLYGPGVSDVLTSVGRYQVVAFPVFLMLAQWSARRPWLEMLLTSGGFLVQAMLALVYLRNGLVN